MNRERNVLSDYGSADEAERLYLFLSYRDLRGEFMKIDMDQSGGAPKERSYQAPRSWINRLVQCCLGL